MRLLNVHTLQLELFMDERTAPPYAILSHTWGDDELTFEDLSGPRPSEDKDSQGIWKVLRCAEEAAKNGLKYIWVDTCCIQKSSSAELSEAINSMFRWYQRSAICYAYLSDVDTSHDSGVTSDPKWVAHFSASRWFTRGWTLQELIAPKHLTFFSNDWKAIGTKTQLATILIELTSIPRDTLIYGDTFGLSVSRRMSWAAKRQTTRLEDMAYCLLGLFDINMPLLYGEGSHAFQRLQEEILKIIDDETIFAWKAKSSTFATWRGLFALSPNEFSESGDFVPVSLDKATQSPVITSRGLRISLPLLRREGVEKEWTSNTEFIATLRCLENKSMRSSYDGEKKVSLIGIYIKKIFDDDYIRVDANKLNKITAFADILLYSQIYVTVRNRPEYSPWFRVFSCFRIRGIWIKNTSPDAILEEAMLHTNTISKVRPEVPPVKVWDPEANIIFFDERGLTFGHRQLVFCIFAIKKERSKVALYFHPRDRPGGTPDWRMICYCQVVEGAVFVKSTSLVRVIDGEAILIVELRVFEATECDESE